MATVVAERLRRRIAAEPFPIKENTRTVQATISVGIAAMRSAEDRDHQARRPGALPRQARRAQPGGRRRRMSDEPIATIIIKLYAESKTYG
jgi:PleD family two-component response regulator